MFSRHTVTYLFRTNFRGAASNILINMLKCFRVDSDVVFLKNTAKKTLLGGIELSSVYCCACGEQKSLMIPADPGALAGFKGSSLFWEIQAIDWTSFPTCGVTSVFSLQRELHSCIHTMFVKPVKKLIGRKSVYNLPVAI